jgi:hypothetical protein
MGGKWERMKKDREDKERIRCSQYAVIKHVERKCRSGRVEGERGEEGNIVSKLSYAEEEKCREG